jgi:hypothetical protein
MFAKPVRAGSLGWSTRADDGPIEVLLERSHPRGEPEILTHDLNAIHGLGALWRCVVQREGVTHADVFARIEVGIDTLRRALIRNRR